VECEEYPQAVVRAGHPTSPGAELPIRAHGAGQTPLDDDEDAAVVVAHVALWSGSTGDSSAAGVNGRGLGVNVNPFEKVRMAAAFVYSYVIM